MLPLKIKRMKNRLLLLSCAFLCLLNSYYSWAYDFKYSADLPLTTADGLYKIRLTSRILGQSNLANSDIRIMDASKVEIPYVVKTEFTIANKNDLKEYRILTNESFQGKFTKLTIENTTSKPINHLDLIYYNSDVIKDASLSGSNDLQKWFVVKEKFYLYSNNNSADTLQHEFINFPLVPYKYLKLTISDSLSLPLNILKAGYYDAYTERKLETEFAGHIFTQVNDQEKKQSYVTIIFPYLQQIDKIRFVITNPKLYYRRFQIIDSVDVTVKKKSYREARYLGSYVIKSKGDSIIELPSIKTQKLILVIENEDNPPLDIENIKMFHLNKYLVTQLKQDQKYTLMFGDDKVGFPKYELGYFAESISGDLIDMEPGEVHEKGPKVEVTKEDPWTKNLYIIWVALGVGIVVLGFLSFKMLSGMKIEGRG
jgi:hypothetical protein